MTLMPDLALILMLLKLLQAKQSIIINRIANAKSIILNGKNDLALVYRNIAKSRYTQIFTSLEIAFFKKFRTNVLNQSSFINRFYLLVIDKIQLVD